MMGASPLMSHRGDAADEKSAAAEPDGSVRRRRWGDPESGCPLLEFFVGDHFGSARPSQLRTKCVAKALDRRNRRFDNAWEYHDGFEVEERLGEAHEGEEATRLHDQGLQPRARRKTGDPNVRGSLRRIRLGPSFDISAGARIDV